MPLSVPLFAPWTVPLCVAANISFPFRSQSKVKAALHPRAAGNRLSGVVTAFTHPSASSIRTESSGFY